MIYVNISINTNQFLRNKNKEETMKIKSITLKNVPPIKNFQIDNLSDLVVIAGTNGVGKTRLIKSILQYLQGGAIANPVRFIIKATSDTEKQIWKKDTLDTIQGSDHQLLIQTLQKNKKRKNFKSSVLNYDSNRSMINIQPMPFSFDIPDPDEEEVGWNKSFESLSYRFQDTQHAIFKKIRSYDKKITERYKTHQKEDKNTMNVTKHDPLQQFKETFEKLLSPKKFEDANIRNQNLTYNENGYIRDINTLSSGEQEVVRIAFDFLIRKPSDCIIFFDEPELHLHPELSYKLISTLRSLGTNNQFIFCSHSPDIISSSLDDSVIFLRPPQQDNSNQAVMIDKKNKTNEVLKQLGHSIGMLSIGKKIVLIEGSHSSLDKKVYGSILKNKFPNLVLVPCQSKKNLVSFDSLMTEVLQNTLWGIDFFMLADKDIQTDLKIPEDNSQKFKLLSKYHLENYFLDENIISEMFKTSVEEDSWLRNSSKIREKLKEIASKKINYISCLTTAQKFRLKVKNINLMPKNIENNSIDELCSKFSEQCNSQQKLIEQSLNKQEIENVLKNTFNEFSKSVEEDTSYWKDNIPGKHILSTFCNQIKEPESRFKTKYIHTAFELKNDCFKEIEDIFKGFSKA